MHFTALEILTMKIKQNFLLLFAFMVVFIFMNVQIFQKETIKTHGEAIFFKLAPVDPRAFMLGDYMALNFEHNLQNQSPNTLQTFIITLDEQKVVVHSEPYQGGSVNNNQRLLDIQDQLRPDRFYFQEGHAQFYDNAKYGLFRYISPKEFLLDQLTDDKLTAIQIDKK